MSQKLVLEVLKDGEFHSNVELCQNAGWRFGGSIHQLKNKGYIFEKEHKHDGDKKYIEYWKLKHEPIEVHMTGENLERKIIFKKETIIGYLIRKIKNIF